MGEEQRLVEYFNACYQADNREQNLWDVFSKNNEYQEFFPQQDGIQYDEDGDCVVGQHFRPQDLVKAIETYRREKTYLYGHHFLIGKLKSKTEFSKTARVICAPLVIFDSALKPEDGMGVSYKVVVDVDSARLNTNLITELFDSPDLVRGFEKALNENPFVDVSSLMDMIQRYYQGNAVFNAVADQVAEESLKGLKRKASATDFKIVEGGVALLSKRSTASRGKIDELNLISESPNISAPLAEIFQQPKLSKWPAIPCQLDNIPGVLSKAQAQSLENAAQQTLSLMIGPPGTGKSYTIACLVLERFLQGESVLVVSENETAVDVVQHKLVSSLGLSSDAVIRAGVKDYHKYLKQYIGDLLNGIGTKSSGPSLRSKLRLAKRELSTLEKRFLKASRHAVADGVYLDDILNGRRKGLFSRLKLWRNNRRLFRYQHLHNLIADVKKAQINRENLLAEQINHIHLKSLEKTLTQHRKQLVSFNSALRARTSKRQEDLFNQIDYSVLLKAMPIWLCSLQSLHKALPLKRELFDLVIIDEATQCDLASAIPAFYRAKRAVVVGDPKQLSYISFLSGERQKQLQKKLKIDASDVDLDYRNCSVIDYANKAISSQNQVTMLDEHYRSSPEIIHFSNEAFYNGSLRIMTQKPVAKDQTSLEIKRVESGVRKRGVNQPEVDAIVFELKDLIDRQATIPKEFKLTIGILSFFRDQAEAIQKQVFKEFEFETLEVHQVRVATPYGFQGEERDIMLISCGVGSDESAASYRYLNRADVFNVAVTRARDLQKLFLSPLVEQLPKSSLLKRYIESATSYRGLQSSHALARDKNIEQVEATLSAEGMTCIRQYYIAGVAMDLVVQYDDHTLAIDLIGFPGEHEDVLHLEHYKIFERAGLTIFPLCYSSWVCSQEAVVEKLKDCFRSFAATDIDKLSIQHLSKHWTKLLSSNPALARDVKALEFELAAIHSRQGLEQLGQLIDAYLRIIWVLNQKLSPSELTYSRYLSASEQVLVGAVHKLEQIITLTKSLPSQSEGKSLSEEMIQLVQQQGQKISECHNAIELAYSSLVGLSVQWSQVDTGEFEESFDSSLTELNRLAAKVEEYSV